MDVHHHRRPLLGPLPSCLFFESGYCSCFRDRASIDLFYGHPIFKCVARTFPGYQVVSAMTAVPIALLLRAVIIMLLSSWKTTKPTHKKLLISNTSHRSHDNLLLNKIFPITPALYLQAPPITKWNETCYIYNVYMFIIYITYIHAYLVCTKPRYLCNNKVLVCHIVRSEIHDTG